MLNLKKNDICVFSKQMMQRIRRVQYSGDPLTLPARSNEIECLVRLFYKLACHINETVDNLIFFLSILEFQLVCLKNSTISVCC